MLCPSVAIAEGFHQHELIRVLQPARPLEPQVARLLAHSAGEITDAVHPFVGALWKHVEFHDDEDHDWTPLNHGAGQLTRCYTEWRTRRREDTAWMRPPLVSSRMTAPSVSPGVSARVARARLSTSVEN